MNENKQMTKAQAVSVAIALAIDIAVTWLDVWMITTLDLALWQQVLLGVLGFFFALDGLRILFGLALMLFLAIYIWWLKRREQR